jgi:hypothetical protein
MKKHSLSTYALLLSMLVSLSSCEAIGAIFKAGVWSGILLVAIIIGVIIFIVSRLGNKK